MKIYYSLKFTKENDQCTIMLYIYNDIMVYKNYIEVFLFYFDPFNINLYLFYLT